MSANSKNSVFLFLVTLHSILSAGYCTASTTLLITGHSSENNYKYAFAQKFVSQVELDRAHSADFLAISSGWLDAASEEEGVVLRTIGGVALSGNLSQVVISRLGSNEMSLEHIQLLFKYIDTDQPLIVVEIGEQSVQTKSLLSKGALCWGEARANILSPNKAYICNDVPEQTVRAIVDFHRVRGLVDPEKPLFVEPQPRQFWPTFFASAARIEKKRGRKPEIVEVDEEDVDDIVDQIMQDIKDIEPAKGEKTSVEEEKKAGDKKLYCRYRKSCYESGERPVAEASEYWFDLEKLTSYFSTEDDDDDKKENKSGEEDHDDDNNDIDEEEDLTPLKLKCKYRLDCYKRKSIKLTGKDEEREQRKSLLAGKSLPQQGKKRTLKDIAERTINKVKVAEEKAAARPVPKAIVVERKLNEIEEKLNEKLACKYRKSCYETGEPPVIESAWVMPSFSTYSAEEAAEEVDFQEMEDLEKKMFCKYRKSCYDTGVKPEIETEFQIHSFKDLKELPDVIETRKMTIQEKCKYRKSCYETGIVPEINPQLETVIEKEVSTVIPSNVDDLRKFCKYRKSCYEEIAQSASVETVKNIRKRRLIEREVRRRKARRARMRRRLRDVELDSISRPVKRRAEESAGRRHVHKARRYAVEKEAPPVEEEEKKQEAPVVEEVEEKVVKKSGKRKAAPVVAEEVIEAVKEVVVEEVAPKVVKSFRSKKHREPEPEPEPEPVPEPEPERPKHRGKRTKEPKAEEVKEEEPEVVEKAPKRGRRQRETEPEEVKEDEPPVEEVKVKKTYRKKTKEEPVEEQKEEVKEEEPEPKEVEPKVVQKQKKGKKPVPVPVPEEAVDEQAEEKKEEHHHVTDAEYREHLRLQMFCKYRKSCYETRERPEIVQTLSTLFATFDSHVNEHYDRLERKGTELKEADRKLMCKYRKSCYESGELPVIRRDEEESEEKEEEVKKEVKREMKKVHAPKKVVKEESEESKEDDNEEVKKVHKHEDLPHLDVHQKLECKYRKSCYTSSSPKQKATRSVVTPHGTVEHKKCNEYYLSCREQLGLPPKIKAPMGPNGRRLCRKKKTEDQ